MAVSAIAPPMKPITEPHSRLPGREVMAVLLITVGAVGAAVVVVREATVLPSRVDGTCDDVMAVESTTARVAVDGPGAAGNVVVSTGVGERTAAPVVAEEVTEGKVFGVPGAVDDAAVGRAVVIVDGNDDDDDDGCVVVSLLHSPQRSVGPRNNLRSQLSPLLNTPVNATSPTSSVGARHHTTTPSVVLSDNSDAVLTSVALGNDSEEQDPAVANDNDDPTTHSPTRVPVEVAKACVAMDTAEWRVPILTRTTSPGQYVLPGVSNAPSSLNPAYERMESDGVSACACRVQRVVFLLGRMAQQRVHVFGVSTRA
jgi:hypothetical protein